MDHLNYEPFNRKHKRSNLNHETDNDNIMIQNSDTYKLQKLKVLELETINSQLKNCVDEQSDALTKIAMANSKFLSIIGHDLRSPIGAIIGILDLLTNSHIEGTEVNKYIHLAVKSANETLALLDNLLVWANLQNKAIIYTPSKLNLLEIVIDELERCNVSASQKQITLHHYISPEIFLHADLQMVKTILRNLINNAIKYSFIGSEVIVSASEGTHYVIIIVQDDGIGISYKAQKSMFEKTELHSTQGTNNEKGTGLGLILCKEFIDKHGGTIRIESDARKGSKFIFTLPR